MEFGYWGFKARGHPIRILMAYLGLEIPERSFSSQPEWGQKKEELRAAGCSFPNLPYLKDGQRYVTETEAVAMAVAFKANRGELFGKSVNDIVLHKNMLGVLSDLFEFWSKCMGKTKAEIQSSWAASVQSNIRPKLEGFAKIIGTRPFLLYYLSYADILLTYIYELYEHVCQHTGVAHPYHEFPVLMTLRKNVLSLPGIKEFQTHPSNQRPIIPDPFAKYTS